MANRYGITFQDLYEVWNDRRDAAKATTIVKFNGSYFTFAGDAGAAQFVMQGPNGTTEARDRSTVEYREFQEADGSRVSAVSVLTMNTDQAAKDVVFALALQGYNVFVYDMGA